MARSDLPRGVRKRDGRVVAFDECKIRDAVRRAALEVLQDRKRADDVAADVTRVVVNHLAQRHAGDVPGIETIQDVVETVLMSEGHSRIAKAYILYRENRSQIRLAKAAFGSRDDLKLSVNAIEVLKRRYLLRDEARRIVETPGELFRRVAHHVAQAEANYGPQSSVDEAEQRFCEMMRNLEFLPNSPTLMNAGTRLGQLSACFVIPIEDSIDGIFRALGEMARIHQTGGGTGFAFSRLRPRGDIVASTQGHASGPISFLSIFDKATEIIVQGGKRRGANMGILRCDHPDIVEFIEAKSRPSALANFNLSVGVTDRFMRAVLNGRTFALVNPRTGRGSRRIRADVLFDMMVNAAWRTGDPGLVFLDHINRANPTPKQGQIEATNPCGEVPLLPYESCILGSINLARMVTESRGGKAASARVDWDRLRDRVRWGVRFLDDVIDVNRYPLESIADVTRANRKIGLGVMGFADLLIRLGIAYDSPQAVTFARKLMRFIHVESLAASEQLALCRGPFPSLRESIHARRNRELRNATVNTIAPTGTISIIAGCSSGIEPLFAISFVRHVLSGTRLFETNPEFEKVARERGFYRRDMLAEVTRRGSLKNIRGIPSDVKKLFVTTFDIPARQHLEIQAAFQRYTDNAVSKTVNLPADATVEDVREIYLAAHRLRCKGITIYRYGSKSEQVLSMGEEAGRMSDLVSVEDEYSGGCLGGLCDF
ncbi:MAG TPA: adenosylcobalamin-dependent ribonucleoside-diphosphate reductase [Sedimentisphaerales bacterium]|nr:adenosylcobalamin-dependent ribonucleoside-diphosphate reductase [Sedimentisphaerales bacterium]HRS10185.1 adenosylcobalamin-dependent ribonucleoside-diphosphate reductase [Sedimentisphaerales bacterium]HRV46891.1 adenosylcobalamin-dependent ribonucleoside-diphosphate reductase [Sedimentisphaerales bacterium]